MTDKKSCHPDSGGNGDDELSWLFDARDQINRPDPTLLTQDFHPNRGELLVLVEHYQTLILDLAWDYFAYGPASSSDDWFAHQRLAHLNVSATQRWTIHAGGRPKTSRRTLIAKVGASLQKARPRNNRPIEKEETEQWHR